MHKRNRRDCVGIKALAIRLCRLCEPLYLAALLSTRTTYGPSLWRSCDNCSAELHTASNTPWKDYWNLKSNGKVDRPLIENQCRNRLLGLLRERLKKYSIIAALPEAQRGEDTRADLLFLTWAGRNLPLEAKRHFHPDLWVAASSQLQGYSADPDADGFAIYLVFWFGNEASPTPLRPDGGAGPTSAIELETMLAGDLSPDLRARTDVIVFDVSDPAVARLKKPRRKRGTEAKPKGSP